MIKHINDGEIDILKSGFHYTLALKKINMLGVNKFMSKAEIVTLDTAIRIYKSITSLNFPGCYEKCSSIMMDYLVKFNLYSEEDLIEINEIFYDDSDENIDEDEFSDWDYIDGRQDYILELLQKLFSPKGKIVHSLTFRDIIFDDDIESVDLNIFGTIRTSLIDCLGTYNVNLDNSSEDDLENEYLNIFQDDAIVYAIEGLVLNDYQLTLLSYGFTGGDSGVCSEAYVENGNTYIVISFSQLSYGIGYSFLILLKLIFMDI